MRGSEYTAATDPSFKAKFSTSVEELGKLILKIKEGHPILIDGHINTTEGQIVDPDLLPRCDYFDAAGCQKLMLALKSMSALGKHKRQADFDKETNGKVNEIFVYVWKKVKESAHLYLPALLVGLTDAAPTCIQGYSVRMLCAVHPPKLKIEAKNGALKR